MEIQEAFNNAMAQALGYHDVDALLMSIPKGMRIRAADRQERFNHAVALHHGFDNVEDLVAANGMRGTAGLLSFKP